jgi:hypothetical protein
VRPVGWALGVAAAAAVVVPFVSIGLLQPSRQYLGLFAEGGIGMLGAAFATIVVAPLLAILGARRASRGDGASA